MNCPVCGASIRVGDRECPCGESLVAWQPIAWSGAIMRQRGLMLASQGEYLGACVSFLEAALSDPTDRDSLENAARAMVRLGRKDDALRLLAGSASRSTDGAARVQQLAKVIKVFFQKAARGEPPARTDPQSEEHVLPSKPPRTAVPATSPAKPTRRPMLALEPIGTGRDWLGRRQEPGPMWALVLRMESQWQGDWQPLRDWLLDASECADHPAPFHYMVGLSHWQQDDQAAARAAFERCLLHKPAVLNPAAYYLCLHLDGPAAARKAWEMLGTWHGLKDLSRLLAPLRQKLETWKAAPMLVSLNRLG